ncbi:ABC transporter permease [Salinispira pacifica]|uniref:ABC transmembrane type-1 domain-containing protein n=1 Tax=Salinispira pacifica TaxID=1307761 RepID=V5WDA4_9SPIO|nr:iron ABC transporter permease [Salinispira pacifica]AHC13808.1 hypothetical protein L21SP2_0374 [Salinispira pacifica]
MILLGLLLAIVVVYPAANLILRGTDTTAISRTFGSPRTLTAILNTLAVAVGSTLFATLLGGCLAWLVVKTDLPGSGAVDTLTFVSFVTPPYILAVAWVQLVGRSGYLARVYAIVTTSDEWNFPYYSIGAVIVVLGLHLYPVMYLSLKNALSRIDPALESAAVMSGAGPLRVFRTVTLPVIAGSIGATGIFVFSRGMANFGVPALLMLPVRKDVLTTRVFSALSELDLPVATVVSFFLVGISTLLFVLQARLTPIARRSAVDHGRNRGVQQPLRRLRVPVAIGTFTVLAIISVLPLIAMVASSFLKRWGLPVRREFLTFGNYAYLLSPDGIAVRALRNSFVFGLGAGAIAALISGGIASLIVSSRRSPAVHTLEAVATWPMAFPNVVIAVATILAWNRPPIRLYGTGWAIVAAYAVLFTPIVLKQTVGLARTHDERLLQAAQLAGAQPLRCFFTVTLPTISPGLRAGILLSIVIAAREIPISLMLYASGQETLGVLLFGMQSQSYGLEMTSALSVLILTGIIIARTVLRRGGKAFGSA